MQAAPHARARRGVGFMEQQHRLQVLDLLSALLSHKEPPRDNVFTALAQRAQNMPPYAGISQPDSRADTPNASTLSAPSNSEVVSHTSQAAIHTSLALISGLPAFGVHTILSTATS